MPPLLVQFGSSGWVPEENMFVFFSLFVVGFGVIGTLWFRKLYGKGYLLNPLVLSSLYVFVIGFGVSNYVLFTATDAVDYYLGADAYVYLNKAMILTVFAMVSLWAGYRSGAGTWLAGKWDSSVMARRFLRREYQLDYRVIMVFIILSFSCRLLQVRFRLFGYTSTIDEWIRLAAFAQWLHAGATLGLLSLLVVSLAWFKRPSDKHAMYLMVFLLTYESVFGFMLGQKSAVVMPLAITGVAYYYTRHRFPWKAFLAGIALLYMAYVVIEPFRRLRYEDPDFQSGSLVAIASNVINAGKSYERDSAIDIFKSQIAMRVNSTLMAACSVKYMDENGLNQDAPEFLRNLILSPLHAVVPRFLWSTKPMETTGQWFNIEVLGAPADAVSASAMTPVGYLYFTGGAYAICIGFFLIGILQQWAAVSFSGKGSGSEVIYFCLLGTLVQLDNSVNAIFLYTARNLLLATGIQYFLFKR